MTKCRFWENRYLPIEYSLDKIQSNEGFFSLCLVKKCVATLEIDNEKCYLSAPAIRVSLNFLLLKVDLRLAFLSLKKHNRIQTKTKLTPLKKRNQFVA